MSFPVTRWSVAALRGGLRGVRIASKTSSDGHESKAPLQNTEKAPLHDVGFRIFIRHADGRHHVRPEIDRQDQYCRQRHRRQKYNPAQKRTNFRNIRRQCVADRLLQIVKNQSTCGDIKVQVVLQFEVFCGRSEVLLSILGRLYQRDVVSEFGPLIWL